MKTTLTILLTALLSVSGPIIGQSQFSQAEEMQLDFHSNRGFVIADFNGDRIADLAMLQSSEIDSDSLSVLIYTSDANNVFTFWLEISTTPKEYIDLHAFDMDNDGDQDLVYTSGSTSLETKHEIGVFENEGNTVFTERIIASRSSYHLRFFQVIDMNKDGTQDIVAYSWHENFSPSTDATLYYYHNDGLGNFDLTNPTEIAPHSGLIQNIGDIDGDELPDVVIFYNNVGLVYHANGQDLANYVTISSDTEPAYIMLADINNDEKLDIVLSSTTKTVCFINYDDGLFSEEVVLWNESSLLGYLPQDIDRDGDVDFVKRIGSDIGFYRNLGQEQFAPFRSIQFDSTNFYLVMSADLDSDSDLDLVLYSFIDTTMKWCENMFGIPHADFEIDVCDQSLVNLSSADYSKSTFQWSIDNDIISNSVEPFFELLPIGTYELDLEVCNELGCDSNTQVVEITHQSILDVSCVGIVNEELDFATSSEGYTNWSWIFGDGTVSTNQNTTHAYTEPGLYTVELFVTDATQVNCTTHFVHEIEIFESPELSDHYLCENFAYPNPSTDHFFISFASDENWMYQLVDVNGVIVRSGLHLETLEQVSTSGLSSGVYVLFLKGDSEILKQKLIVLGD